MRCLFAVALVTMCGWAATWAQDDVASEMERDVVLRALVDELGRSLAGLQLPGLEPPYFIEFGLADVAYASAGAKLGATTGRNAGRQRGLYTDVRVGSYDLDNSNFSGGGVDFSGFGGGGMGDVEVPSEDDYTALRQAIWWAADRDYKGVVEQLAK